MVRIPERSEGGRGDSPSPALSTTAEATRVRATTILAVRHKGKVVIAGDGQVSLGQTVMKRSARKVRRLHRGQGPRRLRRRTADALTLFEKFEAKLEQYHGNLQRAAVELAKDWRTDRVLRRLEALLIVADRDASLLVTGNGDVIEPDDGDPRHRLGRKLRARGGARARAALEPRCARRSPRKRCSIAAELCVYTNDAIVIEELAE